MDSFSAIRLTKQADFIYRFCVCIWPIGHREMSHCYTFEWNTLTKHSLYVRFNSSRNCSIFHKMTEQTTNTGNSTLSTQMPHEWKLFFELVHGFFFFLSTLYASETPDFIVSKQQRHERERRKTAESDLMLMCQVTSLRTNGKCTTEWNRSVRTCTSFPTKPQIKCIWLLSVRE